VCGAYQTRDDGIVIGTHRVDDLPAGPNPQADHESGPDQTESHDADDGAADIVKRIRQQLRGRIGRRHDGYGGSESPGRRRQLLAVELDGNQEVGG